MKYGTAMIAIVRLLATTTFLKTTGRPVHELVGGDRIPRLTLITRKNAFFSNKRLGNFDNFTSSV